MKRRESGATVVEFALILLAFLMFTLGVLDYARLLYTWNAANEATREGARYAAVCADPSSNARVLARMQAILPQITAIQVDWFPAGCSASNCESVTVSLTDLKFTWLAPIPGSLASSIILMPGFSTYLPREMMSYNPLIC